MSNQFWAQGRLKIITAKCFNRAGVFGFVKKEPPRFLLLFQLKSRLTRASSGKHFIDLDSNLVDLNYKVASLIFCHFWRSIYMTWNAWEWKLTHSKSKLMLILSILKVNWWIWIIKLHLWYFVTFGVAYDYVTFRPCTKPLRNVDHVTFDVPFSRTDVFKNSFFVRIRRLWNELLLSITESNTLSIFAKNLMAFYYDKFNVNFL